MPFIPRFLGDRVMAFVTGVITKFVGMQMGAGVNMWTAYRNLKWSGLAAPYTAFADTWAQLYKQRVVSQAFRTTWFTGAVPKGLMNERVLKQAYKYLYTFNVGLEDKATGAYRRERMSLYSNQWMSREEASERVISKQAASEMDYGGDKFTAISVSLDLAEHNIAMEW